MGTNSFILADINNLSTLFSPLKSTHRIKYTCFNVSPNFIILGATSGGLYVFKREPCSFLQLLPNKEGAITRVLISPNEKHFTFSTVKGIVCVLERNVGPGARRVQISSEHQGVEVTALHWNDQSDEIYIGDDAGKVSIISVSGFVAKNMFNTPSFQLMQLDSRIVQLDWQSNLLLVSTITRSYLCDTIKEQYRQIGHKLRDGEYGGCFYINGDRTLPLSSQQRGEARGRTFISLGEGEKLREYEGPQNLKVFCARPGSRLWEVRVDGTVLSTHQFKQALAVPPTALMRLQESFNSSQPSDNHVTNSTNNSKSDILWSQQSFNFAKLLLLSNKYLFTFKKDGIYIFDPEKASVVLWNNEFVDIVDAQTYKDTIYLWTGAGIVHALTFSSLEKFLIRLYMRKQYTHCAQLCEMHNKYLMQKAPTSTKLHLLADLGKKLSNNDVAERILPLLQEISKYAQESKNVQRLDSGIFVVGNHHFLLNEDSETSMHILPETKGADRFKDKSRSLSVSPETTRRRKIADVSRSAMGSRKSESSSSLPELGKGCHADSIQDGRIIASSRHNSGDCVDVVNEQINRQSTLFLPNEAYTTSDSNSPEALQALKEIGQSVSSKITNSTKTLKEKWQILEGKMKLLGQEASPEPLDVKTSDYDSQNVNMNQSRAGHEDIVHSDRPNTNLVNGKSMTHPELDVSDITALSKQICKCDSADIECMDELTWKLFNSILYIYEEYRFALDETSRNLGGKEETKPDISNNSTYLKELMSNFLIHWSEKPFPFQNYFSNDVIQVICERLHDSLKSKMLISWLQNLAGNFETEIVFLEQLSDVYPAHILYMDLLLSRFLIVCSDLLDPHSIIQCIEQCQLPCHYMSFCAVLDKYQEGALKYITGDHTVDNSCWEWPIPLLLNAMFFMLRMDQIETCCMMGNKVSVKDVCYLVLRLQEQLVSSGEERHSAKKHCFALFLSYLGKSSDLKITVVSVLQDQQLSHFATSAFEAVNENLGQSCTCGFPLPLPREVEPQFSELGELILTYYWQTNHDRQLELCRRVPVMWRHLLAHKRAEDLGSVLPLLVQLGDMLELERWLPRMTLALWERTLSLVATLHSGKCLSCGTYCVPADLCKSVSLSMVGALMIKSLGPQCTVDVLMKFVAEIKPGELDARFFQSCILSAIVDKYTSGLRTQVVDVVNDDSAKSMKAAFFSPVMSLAVEKALAQDLGKVPPISHASSVGHHWGVSVDLKEGSCPCCALPLGSEILVRDGGLTVFQCGHSYHSVCLKHRECHSCLVCGGKSS